MYAPPADAGDHQRMLTAFDRAAAALGVTAEGDPAWGWHGRTIGRRAQHPDHGTCWLRLVSAPAAKAGRKLWTGTAEAAQTLPAAINKPSLHALHDDLHNSFAYRAELTTAITAPTCSTTPDLHGELDLPDAWWTSLRTDLDLLAATPTDRVAVRQEYIDRAVPRFTGAPAPRITQWTTAHGDLHPANLTTTGPTLLDWEGWGTAPAGYDAALLYAYSLPAPATAARVHRTFADLLDSPSGHAALLVVTAELLQSADCGDYPDLVPHLRTLINNITALLG
jgi:hypothetical protein